MEALSRRRKRSREAATEQRSVDLKEEVKEGNAEDTAKEEREATGKRNEEPKKRSRTENESAEAQEVPDDWVKVWDGITEMRKNRDAPVDTMGCEVLAEDAEPKVQRYQTLVALMLSSQTKDQQTAAAIRRLQKHGLTVGNILDTPENELDELISNVGFHRNKAKFIKRTSEILREEYDDDIPPDYEGLLKLPGVGPKMAHLTMQCAWHKTEGIGVDVHVHRISNRLGWVHKTKNPEATRKELEEWLPHHHWNQINLLLVGFGQTICTPRNPKCDECQVKDLCPEGRAMSSSKEGKRRASTKAKKAIKKETDSKSDEDFCP